MTTQRMRDQAGFTLVEVLLAITLLALLVTAVVGAIIYGRESVTLSGQRQRATTLAEEGLEASRNIRDAAFANLTDGNHGLTVSGGQWNYSGSSDVTDGFTRQVVVSSVNANTKQVTSTVTWQQNQQRQGTVSAVTYLTAWQAVATTSIGSGMLVYADTTVNGGDGIVYKTLSTAGVWSAPASVPEMSVPNNRPAVYVALFDSPTRNEKILLSKHVADGGGNDTYLYAQVWNGSSWGSLVSLVNWAGVTNADSRNIDGAYLPLSGNFLLVYENNSNTPQYRTWNGLTWTAAANSVNVGGNPVWLQVAARPGTNEAMLATIDIGNDTNTALYNGAAWGGLTEHANPANTPVFATYDAVNFVWSRNNTNLGALVYNEAVDGDPNLKILTRNVGLFGTWGSTIENVNIGGNVQALQLIDRPTAVEWLLCAEDSVVDINCIEGNSTPLWSTLTSGELTTDTGSGTERSFSVSYETSGARAISVYSGTANRAVPKYRSFDPSTNTWSSENTITLSPVGDLVETVDQVPHPADDNVMVLLGDTVQDLRTVIWNGTSDTFFSSGGTGPTAHGINGTGDQNFWFDFAWD